jgi:hypothetical protein
MDFEWRMVSTYVLEGTYLELRPQAESGLFFVVDCRDEDLGLSDALPLRTAKAAALRLLQKEPKKYRRVFAKIPARKWGG